ncbi:MAG: SocA family protein [Phycisphaerae bacterium]|nr:SocA family protein [Phycisphaerae bacterium]
MLHFRFNFEKSLQAVAVLLRAESLRRMNFMRLLKLLYICDKESLKEIGKPITGDRVVAMKRGPVLSHIYNLIKGEDCNYQVWNQYIEKDRFDIFLKESKDPGIELLTKFEIEKINEVSDRYRLCDEWDMVRITHEFLEWKRNDPGESSNPIPDEDILEAIERLGDAEMVAKEADFENQLTILFGE